MSPQHLQKLYQIFILKVKNRLLLRISLGSISSFTPNERLKSEFNVNPSFGIGIAIGIATRTAFSTPIPIPIPSCGTYRSSASLHRIDIIRPTIATTIADYD
jgi:hypothetical protein